MDRRKFIINSTIASSSLMIPGFLKASNVGPLNKSRSGKNLVVIQLSGGNDGLNTIIPFTNDVYYKSRPSLSISKNDVLKVDDELAFHPALKELKAWYDEGYISVINGVGYPNPDRSHFRSMDIWHTASSSNEYLTTGWLGRYLDNECSGSDPNHLALEIGQSLSLSLKGESERGFVLNNPKQLHNTASNPFMKLLSGESEKEGHVSYLYKTLIDTQESAAYIYSKSKTHRSKISYPGNPLAKQLKLIAELMTAELDTKIYYAELNGFDTHANQKNVQNRLLSNLSGSLNAFLKDLKSNRLLDDTLIMVFSEFGRRVKQNGSNGTDHGTANNVWLIGGKLKEKGFYNSIPSLTDLDNGDLKYSVDFRNIYSDILRYQLESNPSEIISSNFRSLGIL